MAGKKDIRERAKALWIKGMKAVGNTAANIANNTRYKVDEVTIQNRRREVFNDLAHKAYALWLKGESFPEPMVKMLDELKQLDEQIRKSRENDLFSYTDICSAFDLSIPTMFIYQGGLKGEKEFLDGRIAMENIECDDAKANIAVEVHTGGDACRLRIFWRIRRPVFRKR